ncbi:MAG: glycosyltransferase [Leptospirales bacterium]|nr:glycosyltransferase [Leptospirales bacterium]
MRDKPGPAEAPQLSAIIPAYNEERYLPATLAALRSALLALPVGSEIIVVDNNSSDATADVARQFQARVVFEAHNQIARARNAGLQAAMGRYVVFLDADTIVSAPLLSACLQELQAGACGGGSALRFEDEGSGFARWSAALWRHFSSAFDLAAGCFLYAQRHAALEIGGFDERYYAAEDLFFYRRLRRWGKMQARPFVMIRQWPPTTSSRKLRWHSSWFALRTLLFIALFPGALRFRRFCKWWYWRPPGASA